jgi:hypothetical protein
MDVESIIDDIQQLEEMFEAPDIRPLDGRSASVTRSKMRAFRQGSFGCCARATCDCWNRFRAHGGWSAMGSTRYAERKRSRSSSAWKRHTT